uniref:T9SS type A sorting domain-containing protein n=1 Tax=candidate division WOR-3 bacterium TaxID=2052148 RepID=A0A7V3KN90_UNCW3
MLLLLMLFSLNQAITVTRAENGDYLEAYNLCMYDDSTSFLALGIYNQSDISSIYVLKYVNTDWADAQFCTGVPGHITGLDIYTYQDSIYLVVSGDSGYINLIVLSVQNIHLGRSEQIEGPFHVIRSVKTDIYRENDTTYGFLVFSYLGSNGDDSVKIDKVNTTAGSHQRWYMVSFTPTYPMDIGFNSFPGISLYHFYFLYVPQSDPNTFYPHIVTYTNNGPYSEHYPFSLVDAQLPSFAATSNYVIDFANRIDYPDSFLYEYSTTSGTGSWQGPVRGIGLSHFYVEGFTIQDTSYFPHLYVRNGKIFHRIFKFPAGNTEPLISEEIQISDTANFADFPLVSTYHSALRNFYRPLMKYSPSKSSMCAVWHQDFWHYRSTPPYLPVLDSTILWMDINKSQGVLENIAGFKMKWDIKEGLLTINSSKQEDYSVEVYDVMGKLVLKTNAKSNVPTPLNLLKKGLYFVKASSGSGVNKVIKILNP